MRAVQGVLFDKDGTLIDFRGTWDDFAAQLIEELAEGDATRAARLAEAMGFDLTQGVIRPGSPLIAGTNAEAAACVLRGLSDDPRAPEDPASLAQMEQFLGKRAEMAALSAIIPLGPFCAGLKARGLAIGVATNDSEAGARAHLDQLGVGSAFDFVAGYDSGFGGKPDPGMLLAFAEACAIAPEACVMVGDSPHDLIAAHRAGMQPVAVLTGIYTATDLAPHARIVLPDIGHLPSWLEAAAAP